MFLLLTDATISVYQQSTAMQELIVNFLVYSVFPNEFSLKICQRFRWTNAILGRHIGKQTFSVKGENK
jgi:hypothetical protein